PVTNEAYIKASSGKVADIDAAVKAAKEAFDNGPWPHMLPRERSRILHNIADVVETRQQELAEMETWDSGLPISQTLGQARRAAARQRLQGARSSSKLRQPQTKRCCRADHPVEHTIHVGILETWSGHCHREHRGAQASRIHSAVGLPVARHL